MKQKGLHIKLKNIKKYSKASKSSKSTKIVDIVVKKVRKPRTTKIKMDLTPEKVEKLKIEKRGRKRCANYIDPKEFYNEIECYYKTNILSDNLVKMIAKIAERLAYAPNFCNYSFKDEMTGDALVKMLQVLKNKKFKLEFDNPFAYFTKVAFHCFQNRIIKEQRGRESIKTYKDDLFDALAHIGVGEASDNITHEGDHSDNPFMSHHSNYG